MLHMLLPSCYLLLRLYLATQVARGVEETGGEEEAYGGEEKAEESVWS